MSGELLRSDRSRGQKVLRLLGAAALCLGLGITAGYTICPVVKRIWTPSWTLFSGGYVLAILALFYLVVDVIGLKRWTYPLCVLGANSILVYMMGQLLHKWTAEQLRIHFGRLLFERVADECQQLVNYLLIPGSRTLWPGSYAPIVEACLVLLVFWLLSWWLYRQKLFVRI
jgi:predicted acyltransferase